MSGPPYHQENFARTYDDVVRRRYPIHARAAQALTSFAEIRPGQIVLDLGAGTGLAAAYVLRFRPRELILLDSSRAMLDMARERFCSLPPETGTRITYVVGDARRLADLLAPASVDVIVSSYLFGLLPDVRGVLRQARTVLRPRGRIVHDVLPSDPASRFVSAATPSRVFNDKLRALLDAQGPEAGPRRPPTSCLDVHACRRIAPGEGLRVVDTLHEYFAFTPDEVENIWRYGWYFTTPPRLNASDFADAIETAIARTRATPEYEAWRASGQPLIETYAAVALRG